MTESAGVDSARNDLDAAVNIIRVGLGLIGAVALVVGILVLVWPGRTAAVVTAIIAIYAIVDGVVYASVGVFPRHRSVVVRLSCLVLGALFVIAGVIALANLGAATRSLATLLGIVVGVMWVFEGVTALTTLGDAAARGWTMVFAVLSIVAGIVVLFSPLWSAAVLWWLLGISLVVLGLTQLTRAFFIGPRLV